jgi:putative cardiolipin synthase
MRLVAAILVALAGFSLASFLALLSYGRFVERARGERSVSLPVSGPATPLDSLVASLVKERRDQSGLMLLDGNLDAFAAVRSPRGMRDAARICNTTSGTVI